MGNKLLWEQPDKMLEANLRWTSVPSGGSRNTLTVSRFILQKPEISAGADAPSGSPNYDKGQTLPFALWPLYDSVS